MKIDIITISIIMIGCVILPFFLFPLLGYLGNTRLIKRFDQEAKRLKLNMDQKESWNQNVIGIDFNQKKLLFVQKRENNFIVEEIDLQRIEKSFMVHSKSSVNVNGKIRDVLQRIDLELSLNSVNDKKILTLFDSSFNSSQDLEIVHAEKWNKLIQKNLPLNAYFKRSA